MSLRCTWGDLGREGMTFGFSLQREPEKMTFWPLALQGLGRGREE